jgi:hypothetical protein
MKRFLLTLPILLAITSRAQAFCKQDGFQLYAQGYSYCYSSNWFGDDIDPFAAARGDTTKWDSNWIYAPPYNPLNPNPTLLLFLGGHGSNADSYTQFMRTAQAQGYYVIGLAYQNGESLQSMCGSFAGCYDEVLAQNVYLGTDNGFYSGLAGPPTNYGISDNSINHRLGNLLSQLQGAHIAGGFPWTQFYNYSTHQVVWSKIIVAGHSEGGATAAWITKNKPVIAGLSFEAPYSMLNAKFNANGTANGAPTASSDFTPYAGMTPVPAASNISPVPYLQCAQPSDCAWANKLHITLNKYDTGYDNNVDTIYYDQATGSAVCESHDPVCFPDGLCYCTLPNWAGVNMELAAYTLKPGQQKMMDASSVPTATAIANNTWYTVSELPTKCVGHLATIVDNCYPNWMPDYWNVLLASVLPPQH